MKNLARKLKEHFPSVFMKDLVQKYKGKGQRSPKGISIIIWCGFNKKTEEHLFVLHPDVQAKNMKNFKKLDLMGGSYTNVIIINNKR